MKLSPLTFAQVRTFIQLNHRHNKPPVSHRFSIGLYVHDEMLDNEVLAGVVVVGRPVARHLDRPGVAEITRLCVADFAPRNACSRLYRAAWRAWREMGGEKILTYTLQSESGESLRGAGFVREADLPAKNGKCWTTRDGRDDQDVVREAKVRWSISRSAA